MDFYNHYYLFKERLKFIFRIIKSNIKLFLLLFIPLFIIIILTRTSEAYIQPTTSQEYHILQKCYDLINDSDRNIYNHYIIAYETDYNVVVLYSDAATVYVRDFNQGGGVVTRRVWTKGVYYIVVNGDDAEDIDNLTFSIILTPDYNSSVDARFETRFITHNSDNIVYWNTANVDVQANPITYSPNFTISQQADLDLASYNTPFFLNGYSGEYKTYDLCTLYIGYCASSSYNPNNPVWQTKSFLLNSESPYLVNVNALDYTYSFNIPSRDLLPGVVVNNSDYIRLWIVKPVANSNGDVLFDKVYHISGRTQQQVELDQQNQTNEQLTELTQGVNDLNQNITSVNDTLNNSDVDTGNLDFNGFSDGFSIEDTYTPINRLFDILYNAFCNDQIENVNLTIPFVNKTMTISSNSISSYYPETLKNFVGLFYWSLIALFVYLQVRQMLIKVSTGQPQNVQTSDIKTEVL